MSLPSMRTVCARFVFSHEGAAQGARRDTRRRASSSVIGAIDGGAWRGRPLYFGARDRRNIPLGVCCVWPRARGGDPPALSGSADMRYVCAVASRVCR